MSAAGKSVFSRMKKTWHDPRASTPADRTTSIWFKSTLFDLNLNNASSHYICSNIHGIITTIPLCPHRWIGVTNRVASNFFWCAPWRDCQYDQGASAYWPIFHIGQYASICVNMRQYIVGQVCMLSANMRQYASICVNMGGQYGGVRKRNICCPAILTNSKVQKIWI